MSSSPRIPPHAGSSIVTGAHLPAQPAPSGDVAIFLRKVSVTSRVGLGPRSAFRALAPPCRESSSWGFYQSLHDGDCFQVKRLTVKPGGRLSLQKHFKRSEH